LAGLDPAIHVTRHTPCRSVDTRHKAGQDDWVRNWIIWMHLSTTPISKRSGLGKRTEIM